MPWKFFRRWLGGDDSHTASRVIRGLPVTVINTRPDVETGAVFTRLEAMLALIERYTPHYYRHMLKDLEGILVQRYACRGAYFPGKGVCLVELTFAVNPSFTDAQRAASLLHEAMHARLDRLGASVDMADRARQERFCRQAEIEFGRLVPDGARIVERALAAIESSDEEVAPAIDPRLAAERIAEVDRAARDSRRS
jgi:hypothetical protein